MILSIYKSLTVILYPLYCLLLFFRLIRGKEDINRVSERFGLVNYVKSKKFLVWIHAASIGESRIALSLIESLKKLNGSDIDFILTSYTRSSASILNTDLSRDYKHFFMPYDSLISSRLFLKAIKPDLTIFIEGELWPCLLSEASKYAPILLINARISDNSFKRWLKFPKSFKAILGLFDLILAQSALDAAKLQKLGVEAINLGNIKFSNPKLGFNSQYSESIKNAVLGKKIVVAASTHESDEKILFEAITRSTEKSNCIFIIVPRHPERSKMIAETSLSYGFPSELRSQNSLPSIGTKVYIADGFGELGLFYDLADIVFIGGSFSSKIGGHSPIEPAHFAKVITFGPNMNNFATLAQEMIDSKSAIRISNSEEFLEILEYFLDTKNQEEKNIYAGNAIKLVRKYQKLNRAYLDYISKFITSTP